ATVEPGPRCVEDRAGRERRPPGEIPHQVGVVLVVRGFQRGEGVAVARGDLRMVPLDPSLDRVAGRSLPRELSENAGILLRLIGPALGRDVVDVLRRNEVPEPVLADRPAGLNGAFHMILDGRDEIAAGGGRARERVRSVEDLRLTGGCIATGPGD